MKDAKCSSIIGGLKFCSASQAYTFKLGEAVNLNLYLVNTTDKEKSLPTVSQFSRNPPYNDSVLDEKEVRIPTILDNLAKKVADKTNTQAELNEYFLRCCVNVGSRWGNTLTLTPYQRLNFDYGLNYKYYFETRGIYYVDIQRNLLVQSTDFNKAERLAKLTLERIKIEIK